MSERRLRIGELAELTGTTPRTIRYYEEIGLLPASEEREQGKRRLYAESDVERLQELIRLRDLLNLSLDELSQLVAAEAARAEIRREFHETEDADQRRKLLDQAMEHICTQLKLVRGRKQELEKLERELVSRQRRVRCSRSPGLSAALRHSALQPRSPRPRSTRNTSSHDRRIGFPSRSHMKCAVSCAKIRGSSARVQSNAIRRSRRNDPA